MATTLAAGDLVITGFNFDNPDEFAFVPLIDITTGTTINFTDDGVRSDGTFRGNEGTFTWTSTQELVLVASQLFPKTRLRLWLLVTRKVAPSVKPFTK